MVHYSETLTLSIFYLLLVHITRLQVKNCWPFYILYYALFGDVGSGGGGGGHFVPANETFPYRNREFHIFIVPSVRSRTLRNFTVVLNSVQRIYFFFKSLFRKRQDY